jgi:outer membrane protein assembly factor BamB
MPGSRTTSILRAVATVAVLSLAASGCWLQRGFGPGRDRFVSGDVPITPANANGLVELWRTTGLAGSVSEPVMIGGNVYLRGGGNVVRLSASTGAVVYNHPVPDPNGSPVPLATSPLYHDGELDIGWQRLVQSGADLFTTGGRARLDPATGDPIEPVVPSEFGLSTDDMAEEGGQIVPQESGRIARQLIAFTGYAQVTWRGIHATFGSQTNPDNFGPSQFAVAGDHLAWANLATAIGWNGTACTNPDPTDPSGTTCLPDWQTPLPANTSGAAASGTDAVVYSVGTNQVHALDAANGGLLFTGTVPGSPASPLSAPVVADGTILVTTSDGRVVAFPASGCGAADCAPLWVTTIGTTGGPAPTVVGNVVFAATTNTIVALDLDGCGGPLVCPRLATYNVGDTITGVAYDSGRLLVTTQNGQVVAFGLPPA